MNIRHDKNIVIVTCGGQHSTLNDWVMLVDELDRLGCPSVIDARSASGDLTEIDAYLLALHTDERRQLRSHRIAIVMSGGLRNYLGFFMVSAKNVGLQIESFECFDTATAWAASNREQQAE
ncbi:MAG: hypothetical protein OER80_11115 [Gammaproteobacteria bacterium]|nr:hypothetical protein [Gammaproteobacteria bacterium]